ncbi:MAG: DNA-binding protein [Leptospiraceae bacterium]|nr:MAG: DNA-binding protein [Leptospiraceae bacterium]
MNRWKDWYEQGIRDLEKAKLDIEFKYFEWACFSAQQASEKVIKSLGLFLGVDLWGHSLTEMLKILSKNVSIPEELINKAKILDLYYIPSRYPNGFPEGKPSDYFTEEQAKEAIDAANHIIQYCKGYIFRKK